MKYTSKSFTVPASSEKAPENCAHQWVDEKRKRCVLCGWGVGQLADRRTVNAEVAGSTPAAPVAENGGLLVVDP